MGEKTELFDESGKSRGFYSGRNRVNDLTGKEWLFWTRSVITKPYPPNIGHKLRSLHGGQKPPELCRDIVKVFTKKGQLILDPFMGVGGILLGAVLADRKAVGIDIEQKWIDIYKKVCEEESIAVQETLCGGSSEILETISDRVFDMVFTDVPYFRMDRSHRSKGTYKKHGEEARGPIQSKLSVFNRIDYADTGEWLSDMERILGKAAKLLKHEGYLAVFIGDMYADNRYLGLSGQLAERLSGLPGLVWKANIVWYDVSKKLHLYGYQYSYLPSMIHQNILVFRKEK